MGGKYEQVGQASDVSFVDPTGQYGQALDAYTNAANAQAATFGSGNGAYDPNAYMNQFLGQSEGLANMAQGATAPLGQSLSAIAARQARLGGEGALAAMPGMRNSGAGMAAFADAYASPFAQAAAQTQAAQLGLTGQLWNQAMGNNAGAQQYAASQYANMMAGRGGLAQGMGSIYQPQYEYKKGFGDYAMDVAGLGVNLATAGMMGPGSMVNTAAQGIAAAGQNMRQNMPQNQMAPNGWSPYGSQTPMQWNPMGGRGWSPYGAY